MDNEELISQFHLSECIQCRKCSDSCPSFRNGGLDPQYTISAVLNDTEIKDVWSCMVCHRCSMSCPKDIGVTEMILALRERSAKEGNVPDIIRRSYSSVLADGRISMPRGRMEALRKELRLPDVTRDQKSIRELNDIAGSGGSRE